MMKALEEAVQEIKELREEDERIKAALKYERDESHQMIYEIERLKSNNAVLKQINDDFHRCEMTYITEIEKLKAEIVIARKEEREKCAKVCDKIAEKYLDIFEDNLKGIRFTYTEGVANSADLCADEIRKMGDT